MGQWCVVEPPFFGMIKGMRGLRILYHYGVGEICDKGGIIIARILVPGHDKRRICPSYTVYLISSFRREQDSPNPSSILKPISKEHANPRLLWRLHLQASKSLLHLTPLAQKQALPETSCSSCNTIVRLICYFDISLHIAPSSGTSNLVSVCTIGCRRANLRSCDGCLCNFNDPCTSTHSVRSNSAPIRSSFDCKPSMANRKSLRASRYSAPYAKRR